MYGRSQALTSVMFGTSSVPGIHEGDHDVVNGELLVGSQKVEFFVGAKIKPVASGPVGVVANAETTNAIRLLLHIAHTA